MTKKDYARFLEDMGRVRLTDDQYAANVTPANDSIKACDENTPFETTSKIIKANVDPTFLSVSIIHDVEPCYSYAHGNFGLSLEENELFLMTGTNGQGESRNELAECADLLTTWVLDEPARLFDKKKPGMTRKYPRCLPQVWNDTKKDQDGNELQDAQGFYIDNCRDISTAKIVKIAVDEWRVPTDEDGRRDPEAVTANGEAEFTLQWRLMEKMISGQEIEYPALCIFANITRAPPQYRVPGGGDDDQRKKYSDQEIHAFYLGDHGVLKQLERRIACDFTLGHPSGSDMVDCCLSAANAQGLHNTNLFLDLFQERHVILTLLEAWNKDAAVSGSSNESDDNSECPPKRMKTTKDSCHGDGKTS